jgi:protein-S-isoprenylcysteine O-methyltransferase Ste14
VAGWALALVGVYLALAFGFRIALQLRRTGSTGIAGLSGPPIELLSGGLLLSAIALGGSNPVLALTDAVEPLDGIDGTAAHGAGFALCILGIAGTFVSQLQMGVSWRIGVDERERTELVTDSLFAQVRNPIYTSMVIAWTGFALLVPTWIGIAAVPLVVAALELQVRVVEEPHLLRAHGDTYRRYARRVGRFLPGIGRI